jgi:hypothetical protein
LANLNSISFGNDAIVKLEGVLNLPKFVDVSRCKKIKLEKADVSKVEKIVFRDEEQMNKSLFNREAFQGKVVFSDMNKEKEMEL